jgi:outer membrane lipoprotein-sorting protein
MRALIVLVALPAIAAAQPKPQLTPAQALAKIEATYKKQTDLTASFTQTVTYAINDKTTKSTGTLFLAKPDKARFDYVKKAKSDKTILFDGSTLWLVEPANLKITKQDARGSALPALFRFFTGTGSLTTEFALGTPAPKQLVPGAIVLELLPKQPSAQYKELYLVVDPTTWTVTRATVINSSGDVNTFELANVETGRIKPEVFALDPKKSYPDYKVETMAKP